VKGDGFKLSILFLRFREELMWLETTESDPAFNSLFEIRMYGTHMDSDSHIGTFNSLFEIRRKYRRGFAWYDADFQFSF